jgi:hypothetical protein
MPHETTQYYTLSGWQTVTLYTESEMAEALDLSISELRDALEGGKYGLSYHSHPLATYNREYEFLRSSYEKNIEIWNCIKAGGHFLEFSRYSQDIMMKSRERRFLLVNNAGMKNTKVRSGDRRIKWT